MKPDLRWFAGLAIVGLAVAALALLNWKESEPPPGGEIARWTSSQQCASCHAAVFEDWKKSLHARAWTDPPARALSNEFQNTDCIACHAPRPVFEIGVGQRVLARQSRRVEGVDCISCHATEHGVASASEGKRGPCLPTHRAELRQPEFCAGCHNQHGTVDEWRKTEFAKKGITCVTCHMPPTQDSLGRKFASHHAPVREDSKMIASAVTCDLRIEQGKAIVSVANTGAGHDFPTDSRHKAADLVYRIHTTQEAPIAWTRLARFRDPYRDDQLDLVRTTIPAGEKREHSISLPAGKGRLEVRLLFKQTPFARDDEGAVIWESAAEFSP